MADAARGCPLIDSFGRQIRYLRLSVTDRCDLRCVYCLPAQARFLPRAAIPSLDELATLGVVLMYGLMVLCDLGMSGLEVPAWRTAVRYLDGTFLILFMIEVLLRLAAERVARLKEQCRERLEANRSNRASTVAPSIEARKSNVAALEAKLNAMKQASAQRAAEQQQDKTAAPPSEATPSIVALATQQRNERVDATTLRNELLRCRISSEV